jgi:hypothetical protein
MASETFKKRQKGNGSAREKAKKAARLMERRNEKTKAGTEGEEESQKQPKLKWP